MTSATTSGYVMESYCDRVILPEMGLGLLNPSLELSFKPLQLI